VSEPTDRPIPLRRFVPAGAAFVLPFALFLTLNYLRPDLLQPMLDHAFGYALVFSVMPLTVLGALAQVLVVVVRGENQTARTLIAIAGFLLCTLPALFLVLFGPVVFAFMFGGVE